ncbi:MAG: HIT domain-containing protein [Phycisphaerae bacterium]|nr:HIT domain-containing protein [Phycisphaerae bacterium]
MSDFQKNIWAPWRMEYIDTLDGGEGGCFLCDYREHPERNAEQYVLWRGVRTLVLLNRFPYTSGHVLVAPLRHVGALEELADDELLELICMVRDAKRVLERAVNAQGFNIGFNLGRCAGAGLPDHMHCHIVPRWSGDVNYMAVLGDVKVIPQALKRTAELFAKVAGEMKLPAGGGA